MAGGFLAVCLFLTGSVMAQRVIYPDALSQEGFSVKQSTIEGITLDYSVHTFTLADVAVKGEHLKSVTLPGSFLFNEEGAPDLPGYGRFIAIPQGATPKLNVINMQSDILQNVLIAPAPRLPKDDEDGPLFYHKNRKIYNSDSFYPKNPVSLSQPMKIRGVDVVLVGVTPFQYNPVTQELVIYRDLEIQITFEGGNGVFGEERLRSRFWDPILADNLLNYSSLPEIDYNARIQGPTDLNGYEYLIICPNSTDYLAWADSIRRFRIAEGISTVVKTLTEVGGNSTSAIENYINTAYNTWTPAPAAVLLMGDYGSNANINVLAPIYNNYCASDNIYADVDNDHLPDVCLARMTANNEAQLSTMCTKFLDYERNPPTSASFYDEPITALGWQTERWFQICSETVGGYWKYEKGKNPVRINEVYSGTPGSVWSTATNTSTVLDYFGPNGQNYIPATPSAMPCCWTGGNATAINNAINSGAFALMHRDHGSNTGWGEPSYNNSSINGLTNNTGNKLPFIFSINCLTGNYNWSSECFAEKFHRYTYQGENAGALGLIAASEVSYSFVNDTYVWGMMDNFWTDFMPTYGTNPASRDFRPCFGNAAGKYFLSQSNWPYNTGNKQVTYHLFHHHGDAFLNVYSEVPQNLTVVHNTTIPQAATSFSVTANNVSFICLSVDDEILGTANGTGSSISIPIPGTLIVGDTMIVTVTMQNYFRYKAYVPVQFPGGPIPDFSADTTAICQSYSVDFTDLSTNNPTSWNWSFPGGTPSSSTAQNPQNIVYNAAGTYDVTLEVSNSLYTNSTTKTNYILVSAPAGTPGLPQGDTLLCQNNPNSNYVINPVTNATGYTWTLIPDSAGIMTQNDTSCIIDWSDTFKGYASLNVQATNACGSGNASPILMIHLRPFPDTPDQPVGPASMCQGTVISVYTTNPAANAESYVWKLDPVSAGTISGTGTTGTVSWDPGFSGAATVKVKGSNECNESPYSDPVDVMVNTNPSVNLGNDTTLLVSETLELDAGNQGMAYLWSTGDTTQSILVSYEGNLVETYWVNVDNQGCTGNDTIRITYVDPVGMPEQFGSMSLMIAPNPNNGIFRIEMSSPEIIRFRISMINALGTQVIEKGESTFTGNHHSVINIAHLPGGMYTLLIHANNQLITKKIVVRK